MKRAYILLGGFVGVDGYATSAGMYDLARMLDGIAEVKVYTWDRYKAAAADMAPHPIDDKIIVIGYSGGGSRALWLNRDNPHQHIDLMVLYDPSPRWQMINPNAAVKRCLLYYNTAPFFFGLGGGICSGPQVARIEVAKNHMLVQGDMSLHRSTVAAVSAL